jgi:hypothetical protein
MKGIIFTAFLDLVEEKFGMEMLEEVISSANLPNEGAYTSVGTYDHSELIAMVVILSEKSSIAVEDLVKAFGEYLFGVLSQTYPHWLEGIDSAFGLLEKVDGFIHVEVKKLYPDAKPPDFDCRRISSTQLEMIYHSPRGMGDVAEGLILGCATYYAQSIGVQREKIGSGNGETERFLLTLNADEAV